MASGGAGRGRRGAEVDGEGRRADQRRAPATTWTVTTTCVHTNAISSAGDGTPARVAPRATVTRDAASRNSART